MRSFFLMAVVLVGCGPAFTAETDLQVTGKGGDINSSGSAGRIEETTSKGGRVDPSLAGAGGDGGSLDPVAGGSGGEASNGGSSQDGGPPVIAETAMMVTVWGDKTAGESCAQATPANFTEGEGSNGHWTNYTVSGQNGATVTCSVSQPGLTTYNFSLFFAGESQLRDKTPFTLVFADGVIDQLTETGTANAKHIAPPYNSAPGSATVENDYFCNFTITNKDISLGEIQATFSCTQPSNSNSCGMNGSLIFKNCQQ